MDKLKETIFQRLREAEKDMQLLRGGFAYGATGEVRGSLFVLASAKVASLYTIICDCGLRGEYEDWSKDE